MRTGQVIKADKVNDHLGLDEWIEVFPSGSVREHVMLERVPKMHKTASRYEFRHGQSPLLLRKSFCVLHPELMLGIFQ